MSEPRTNDGHASNFQPAMPPAQLGTVGELIQRVANDASALARDEMALAKLELKQAAQQSALSIAAIVLSGVFSLIALGMLCMTSVVALAPFVPSLLMRMLVMSLAFLCIASLVGGIFFARLRRVRLDLPKTRAEARETVETLASEVRRD